MTRLPFSAVSAFSAVSLLAIGCGESHLTVDAAEADATAAAPVDAGTITTAPRVDAFVAPADAARPAPDTGPPPPALPPGEIRCFDGEACAVGEICCREVGCVPEEEDDGIAACLLCDDDSDCVARGTPGACFEGPFAIGGGLRWACTEVAFGVRVCDGDDCLTLRELVPRRAGEVECDSGYLGYRTCAVGEVCCDDVCRLFTSDPPVDQVCHQCSDDPDCGGGAQCCSVTTAGRYVGNRCVAEPGPC